MTFSVNPAWKVGMFGGGVVAGGVVSMLASHKNVEFVYMVVKNTEKKRDFDIPASCRLIPFPAEAELDEALQEVDIVVELMGGVEEAWEVVKGGMERGKVVVTANKALLSSKMEEIEQLEAEHPSSGLLFEAAVCGGIPIISTLQRALRGDKVEKVAGIMNGTTNYMLTEMDVFRKPYSEALSDAQMKGYAEADPSADVQGWDARSKLCILGKMCFGKTIDEDKVPCQGIDKIKEQDHNYAGDNGMVVKLLGYVSRSGSTIRPWVSPCLVSLTSPLASCHGPSNMVLLSSACCQSLALQGPGAGRFPTATSVVGDILEVVNGGMPGDFRKTRKIFEGVASSLPEEGEKSVIEFDFSGEFYVRKAGGEVQEKVEGSWVALKEEAGEGALVMPYLT